MKKNLFIWFLFAMLCMVTISSQAGTPLWTFNPLTATNISVPNNGSATVQYQVINQSNRTHTLQMNSIAGVTQSTSGAEICGNPFVLSGHSSCVLSLQINGSQIQSGNTSGPVVCEQGSSLQCYRPNSADTLNVKVAQSQYTVGGTISGLSGTVILLNNGEDADTITSNGSFVFAAPIAEGGSYNVTVDTQPAGQTCTVTNGSGTMGGDNVTNVSVSCAANTTTLSTSLSNLALAASGTARRITVRNTGSTTAENLSISYPAWPSGTIANSACGSTLNAGDTCTITVTPGAIATSNCNTPTYIAPTPGVISVSASNVSSSATTDVVVLTYGCIYQEGYVFAIDDSTANNESIGGTIVSQINQSNGVFWSYNGNAGTPHYSADIIPGTDETSTPSSGSPTYTEAHTTFNSTYNNTSTYPFPSLSSFSVCDGATDGACNAHNILELYNTYITNYGVGSAPYTLSPGPTNLTGYAAGVCSQYTIDSSGNSPCSTGTCYNNWYLPAICQMGASGEGAGCSSGIQNIVTELPLLISGCSGPSCLSGIYWGSTEYSGPSAGDRAWYQEYNPNSQYRDGKDTAYLVRCSRALSF